MVKNVKRRKCRHTEICQGKQISLRERRIYHSRNKNLVLFMILFVILLSFMACQNIEKDSDTMLDSKQDELTAEFLKEYSDYFEYGWVPNKILNYSESGEFVISDEEFVIEELEGSFMGYITEIKNNTILVDEIKWVLDSSEPNGFRIENDIGEEMGYVLDDDCNIWPLVGSAAYYRISIDDLKGYLDADGYESKPWHILKKDDKVTLIAEQYVP